MSAYSLIRFDVLFANIECFLLQPSLELGNAHIFRLTGNLLHPLDAPRQVDGGRTRFCQRIALPFQFGIKRIKVLCLDRFSRQAHPHCRGNTDGRGAANDHRPNCVIHILDRLAIDKYFFQWQASLIDHTDLPVNILNGFNHDALPV